MRKGNFTYRRENSMIIEQGEYLHLQGKNISYILRIHKAGYLLHHYFGKKLRPNDYTSYPAWHRSFYTYNSDKVFLEGECQEYPTFGYIDLKLPALKASEKGKTAIFSFKYKRHEIKEGKPDLPGLLLPKPTVQTVRLSLSYCPTRHTGLSSNFPILYSTIPILSRAA